MSFEDARLIFLIDIFSVFSQGTTQRHHRWVCNRHFPTLPADGVSPPSTTPSMSRHPSPGPSYPHSHPQAFQPILPSRQKSKGYATGIAAGAEDLKYQAKYKELKRKVKEIEAVCFHPHPRYPNDHQIFI